MIPSKANEGLPTSLIFIVEICEYGSGSLGVGGGSERISRFAWFTWLAPIGYDRFFRGVANMNIFAELDRSFRSGAIHCTNQQQSGGVWFPEVA